MFVNLIFWFFFHLHFECRVKTPKMLLVNALKPEIGHVHRQEKFFSDEEKINILNKFMSICENINCSVFF